LVEDSWPIKLAWGRKRGVEKKKRIEGGKETIAFLLPVRVGEPENGKGRRETMLHKKKNRENGTRGGWLAEKLFQRGKKKGFQKRKKSETERGPPREA